MQGQPVVDMLTQTEWYQTASGLLSVIIASVGGGTVVAGVVSKFITDRILESKKAELGRETERLKGSLSVELERLKGLIARDTETHKTQMKRIEIIQNKEIDSVLEFMRIARTIYPERSDPDEDYHEACAKIVWRLSAIYTELQGYLVKHRLFLSAGSRKLVSTCAELAGMHQFDIAGPEDDASSDAISSVEKIIKLIGEAEAEMIKDVRGNL